MVLCGPLLRPARARAKAMASLPTKPNQQPHTWLESPPGLSKVRPMKISKVQQEATDLLSAAWTTLTEETHMKDHERMK